MIKIDYPNEIQESIEELRSLHACEVHIKLRERLEILIWLKSGKVSTMKSAMALKSRSTNHGSRLWKSYRSGGMREYLSLNYIRKRSPLADRKELEERLNDEGFSTIKEARDWILSTYGLRYTENGLGNYFRRNKIKLKTGRPDHPKKDEVKREAYKKNTKKN